MFLMGVGPLIAWRGLARESQAQLPVAHRDRRGRPLVLRLLGVRSTVAVVALALTIFVTATIAVDLLRATAPAADGERALPASAACCCATNRRYGGSSSTWRYW